MATLQEDLARLQGEHAALSQTFAAVAAQQQQRTNQIIGLEATIAYVRGRIADEAQPVAEAAPPPA